MTAKGRRQVASRRVSWPEPGRENGSEFRLTGARLLAIFGAIMALVAAVPVFWALSDHYMNRAEVEKAMKSHADHDIGVQQWNQFGFAANRVEYLDDRSFECDAKRLANNGKLRPDDVAICARYEAKLKAKTSEAADLRTKALEATKEK